MSDAREGLCMVRLASSADVPAASKSLALAFAADPVLASLLGHRRSVAAALARYFEIELPLTLAGRGEVWVDDRLLGAAVWHKPGAWPQAAQTPLGAALSYARLFSRQFVTASRVATVLARSHPEEPHWYLPFVGVVPAAAGAGRGTALLEPVLSRCDRDSCGAYLEATSAASARLFKRLRFRPLEEIVLPNSVVVRPMWREPHSG